MKTCFPFVLPLPTNKGVFIRSPPPKKNTLSPIYMLKVLLLLLLLLKGQPLEVDPQVVTTFPGVACSGLENPINIDHLYQFGKRLQSILGLKLKDILPKALLSDDIGKLQKSQFPFLDLNQTLGPAQKSSDNSEDEHNEEALMAEFSSHPVHLVTKNSKTTLPSAFIPFCAYKTDLLLLGEYIEGLEFPICNKFTPTVLDGQLCYTFDISSVLPDMETLDGKDGELLLLLDYNTERSVSSQRSTKTNTGNGKRYISTKLCQNILKLS